MENVKSQVFNTLDQLSDRYVNLSESLSIEELVDDSGGVSMAWTLAHLACLDDWSINRSISDSTTKFEENFRTAFAGGGIANLDQANLLPSEKEGIIDVFKDARSRTLEALKGFDVKHWDDPVHDGSESLKTKGVVWQHLVSEGYWHLGQLSLAIPKFRGTLDTILIPRL